MTKTSFFASTRLLTLALVLAGALVGPGGAQAAADSAEAQRCMALNLYWEARSEGTEGLQAVAWVVLNRVKHKKFPNTICGVIHQGGVKPPCQWSWWCDGRSDKPKDAKSWAKAQSVTDRMLGSNPPADPTHGAVYFHLDSLSVPSWLRNRESTAHLGRHIFYR